MNKGQWVVLGFVSLALATSAAYIGIQMNASPAPPPADSPIPAPQAPADAVITPTPPSPVEPAKAAPQTAPSPLDGTLSEAAARAAAIRILKGNPYGLTDSEVAGNIASQRLSIENGRPMWIFNVRVASGPDTPGGIAGELLIDGKDGSLISAGLPFLD